MMEKIEKDFEELLELFNKHKVKYCIIGAFAVAFHAVARYTKDMDIFVDHDLANATHIVDALNEFGFISLGLSAADFCQTGSIIQLGIEPVRIDIINSISGCTAEAVWRNCEKGRYGAQEVYFIGRGELIQNKEAAGRPQDIADVARLKNIAPKK
jgi:hypothetical protein